MVSYRELIQNINALDRFPGDYSSLCFGLSSEPKPPHLLGTDVRRKRVHQGCKSQQVEE